jgi:hypothetical protein
LDFRSFHLLKEAVMVLLHKTQALAGLKDYRPISLIHSVGKLFSKTMALRLAPRMHEVIKINQSAFIQGRRIHEIFRTVQLSCRWLHVQHVSSVLLKIDLAKAFDLVAWPFLLEVLVSPAAGVTGVSHVVQRQHKGARQRPAGRTYLPRPWPSTGRPPIAAPLRHRHGGTERATC